MPIYEIPNSGNVSFNINPLKFRKAWDDSTTYNLNDLITYNNVSYYALRTNTNKIPNTNPSEWSIFLPSAPVTSTQRITQSINTGSISNNANASLTINLAKEFVVYRVSADLPCRVRLYQTASQQIADLTRNETTPPGGESGVILDTVLTSDNLSYDLSPLAFGASLEVTPSDSIPITITNKAGVSATINVTIVALNLSNVSSAGGGGGGSGETNTASNVGVSGVGVFKQKTGVNLEFKTINAGSSKVTVSNDTSNNEVDIDVVEASLNHGNISGVTPINKGGTGLTSTPNNGQLLIGNGSGYTLASLTAGTNVTITNSSGGITINSTGGGGGGEVASIVNVGTAGVGIYKQKTGTTFELKKINSGSNKITITDDTSNNEVDIDVIESNLTLANLSGTLSIGKGGTGSTSANTALNSLLPSQSGNSGKVLTSDGTNTSWTTVSGGGGGAGVDLTSAQTITGTKTFTSSIGANSGFTTLLSGPTTFTATGSSSGGSLPAGTYYYKIVGYDYTNNYSLPSFEVSVTTTGTTGSVSLSWSAVATCQYYAVYRGTTSNGQNVYYSAGAYSYPATCNFTDTGATPQNGTVPTSGFSKAYTLDGTGNVTAYGFLGSGVIPSYAFHVRGVATSSLLTAGMLVNNGFGGCSVQLGFSTYDVGPGSSSSVPALALRAEDNNYSCNFVLLNKSAGSATNPLVERLRVTTNGTVGINMDGNNPNAALQIVGGLAVTGSSTAATDPGGGNANIANTLTTTSLTVGYLDLTTNTTLVKGSHNTAGVNASGGAVTITLPTAVNNKGIMFRIKKTDSSANAVTIATTSSQTIDGSATRTLTTQYAYITVISNNTNWLIF